MKFWLKKALGKNGFDDARTSAAGNRETESRPDTETSREAGKDFGGNPMLFAIMAGVLGTVVTLGLIYYLHTAAGGNWITRITSTRWCTRGGPSSSLPCFSSG